MEKYIYDRGLWYEREGDYYIPCLPPNDPETDPKDNPSSFQTVNTEPQEIGAWGDKTVFVYSIPFNNTTINTRLEESGCTVFGERKQISHISPVKTVTIAITIK